MYDEKEENSMKRVSRSRFFKTASFAALFAVMMLINLATAMAYYQSHNLSEIRNVDTNLNMGSYQINASQVNATRIVGRDGVSSTPTAGTGVYGAGSSYGVYGSGSSVGVIGNRSGTLNAASYPNTGVIGTGSDYGVVANGSSAGVYALGGTYGVMASGSSYGLYGASGASNYGYVGWVNGYGIYGRGTNIGVYGNNNFGDEGYLARQDIRAGVSGWGLNVGVLGNNSLAGGSLVTGSGVQGIGSTYGVYGSGTYGTYGSGTTYGVYGSSATHAGYFSGNVTVTQNLTANYLRANQNVTGTALCIGVDCRISWPAGNTSATGSTNYIPVFTSSSNIGNSVMYQSGSNIGIGTTSPDQSLKVNGNANVSGTLYASNVSSNSPLQLQTAGTTRMYVSDSTGNVGIGAGVTSPASTLSVGGNGQANTGVYGTGSSYGIYGSSSYGVYGYGSGYGVYGYDTSGNYGYLGDDNYGVYGSGSYAGIGGVGSTYGVRGSQSGSGNYGYLGDASYGVYGKYGSTTDYGYLGASGTGAFGYGTSFGVYGNSVAGFGVYGLSTNSNGVYGYSSNNIGVRGQGNSYGVWGTNGTVYGYVGSDNYGVYGEYDGSNNGYLGANGIGAAGFGTSYGMYGTGGTYGVYGYSNGYGVQGVNANSPNAYGVLGGNGYGVYGYYDANNYGYIGENGDGVSGKGTNYGVMGQGGAYGVYGWGGSTAGVRGYLDVNTEGNLGYTGGYGVWAKGSTYGVYGQYDSNNYGWLGNNGNGVYGLSWTSTGVNGSGQNYGVFGCSASQCSNRYGFLGSSSYGAYGQGSSTNYGYLGGTNGAYGQSSANINGYLGGTNYGAYGQNTLSNYGYLGGSDRGVFGTGSTYGIYGVSSGTAVYGYNTATKYGYLGSTSYGAYGQYDANNFGYVGANGYGVVGDGNGAGNPDSGSGVYGTGSTYGVRGEYSDTNFGYLGNSVYGAYAQYDASNYGYLGSNGVGAYGRGTLYGGLFSNVDASGNDYGVWGEATGAGGTDHYGAYGSASGATTNYGLRGTASSGTTSYGVYATATGATTNWAGYFGSGNVYVANDLGIGTTTLSQELNVAGDINVSQSGARLILNTPAHNDGTRAGIKWDNNAVGAFEGDDSENQIFQFYSKFGSARTNDAIVEIHGNAAASYGIMMTLTHDGTDGIISTDTGDLNLNPAGNVGIGTAAPAQELDVLGDIQLDSTGTGTTNGLCHSGANSAGAFTDRDIVACSGAPGDVAEWHETSGDVSAGDVVVTSSEVITYESPDVDAKTGTLPGSKSTMSVSKFVKSSRPYETQVVGIVSSSPAQSYGRAVIDYATNPQPIAVVGQVPVKVTDENGPINIGDLLTTSSTPGHAMKCPIDTPEQKLNCMGAIVGKALEPLDSGEGKIMALVTLQ